MAANEQKNLATRLEDTSDFSCSLINICPDFNAVRTSMDNRDRWGPLIVRKEATLLLEIFKALAAVYINEKLFRVIQGLRLRYFGFGMVLEIEQHVFPNFVATLPATTLGTLKRVRI